MPFGDGTGPMGMGPMTGRGAGYCAGFNMPGYANSLPGRPGIGLGRGMGRGMGRGYGFYGKGRRFMPVAPYQSFGYPGYGRGFSGYPYF